MWEFLVGEWDHFYYGDDFVLLKFFGWVGFAWLSQPHLT